MKNLISEVYIILLFVRKDKYTYTYISTVVQIDFEHVFLVKIRI